MLKKYPNVFVSYHGESDSLLNDCIHDHSDNIFPLITDVINYTPLDEPLYEILRSHHINAMSMIRNVDMYRFYNNSTLVCATNSSYYVKRTLEDPPTDVLPNVVYFERAQMFKSVSGAVKIDFTTFTCEFSTFMKVVLLWRAIHADLVATNLETIDPTKNAESILRKWIDALGIGVVIRRVVE